MKKFFYYICPAVCVLALSSCGGGKKEQPKSSEKKVSVQADFEPADLTSETKGDENWFMAQTEKAQVESVSATSELVEAKFAGKYLYPPINIVDGDVETAWCESVDGDGIGQSVTLEFSEPVSFDEIQLANGFAVKKSWQINNRIKTLQLTQVANEHFQRKNYELQDTKDWQSIKFDLTQTAAKIVLEIIDVYKGDEYEDTCLSEIKLLYQGKEIPFAGVDQLKKVQEENSRAMLNSDFDKKFKALFARTANAEDVFKYLVLDGGNDAGYVLRVNTNEDSFDLVGFDYCTFLPSDTKEETLGENLEKISKSTCTKVAAVEDGPRFVEYSIGNCKIYEKSRLSYVSTTVARLVRIDGNKVIINGVEYSVVPSSEVFVAYMPV